MSKSNHEQHNKGQTDRATGKSYSPPYGAKNHFSTSSKDGSKSTANKSYAAGWKNK